MPQHHAEPPGGSALKAWALLNDLNDKASKCYKHNQLVYSYVVKTSSIVSLSVTIQIKNINGSFYFISLGHAVQKGLNIFFII